MDLYESKRGIFALMLFSTLLIGWTSASADEPVYDPLVEEAKAIVKASLKDPNSSQFQKVVVIHNSLEETVVCGEYNARNSYGGYVGFKPFGVVTSTYTTETEELERMGCFGLEAEMSRRQKDARIALTDRFHAEADFNCNVIWTFLDNHFRNGETMNSVLDAAMIATVNRARENGGDISSSVTQMIRKEYESALLKTANEKNQVKSIRRGDAAFKLQFIKGCTLQTVQAMEAQSKG